MRPREISGLPLCQAVLLTLVGFFAWAGTIFVPADFPTIQEAIDAAVDGDVIQVDPGTYLENIDFLGKAITVTSIDPLDPAIVETTIIDGSACTTGVDFCSVVTFATAEGPDSVLDGFTITGGQGSDFGGDIVAGGGIYCEGASPTILNCTINGNVPAATYYSDWAWGGGIAITGGSPLLINCTVSGNTAPPSDLSSGRGGGIANLGSPTLINCTVSGNTAGGLKGDGGVGGGIWSASDSPLLINCTVSGNSAGGNSGYPYYSDIGIGGGIAFTGGGSPLLINCTVSGNTAGEPVGGYPYSDGGGGGGIAITGDSIAQLRNCIVWGNAPTELEAIGTSFDFDVGFSDILGGYPGIGNIDLDPLFVDAGNGDFRLQEGSPCINLGTNDQPGGLPPTDADGNPRVVCGVVDMGAYEAPEPVGGCAPLLLRGDCNDDGAFDIGDPVFLLNELFAGGDPASCDDACDMNDDGLKDIGDAVYGLNALFSGGPSPTPPHPSCGSDPTADGLDCNAYSECQ